MGRAPCCDKNNVKKGPWSPEEDAKLKAYIEEHGTGGNWIALPQKIGLKRCGKSCRLRWLNYLRPNIKHGGFSEEEDNIICSLFISIGSRWSIIAAQLPGRTDNDIKNYWNTRLKKKLFGKQRREHGGAKAAAAAAREKQAEMRKAAAAAAAGGMGENPMMTMMMAPLGPGGGDTNNTPPWPELQIRYSATTEDPSFNNQHQSIKNLLIKLGGRFGDNMEQQDQQQQKRELELHYPTPAENAASFAPLLYHDHNQLHVDPLNATTSPTLSSISEIPNLPSAAESCFLQPIVYTDDQKLDGLDLLYDNYATLMSNNNVKLGSSSGASMDYYWGEMMMNHSSTSLAFAPSNYAAVQPAVFDEGLIGGYSTGTQ